MKNILVAVDFSAVTEKLLEAAAKMARKDSKVFIIHVAAPEPDFVGLGVGPDYIRKDRAETLREEHRLLGKYKQQIQKKGVKAEALLVSGPTVETLLAEIEKLEAQMLVIGRKGHSKLYEVIVGSVCKDILGKLKIPVLVIPQPAA